MKCLHIAAWIVLVGSLCGGCPTDPMYVDGNPRARLSTSLGDIVIELDPNDAPLTVANFQTYVTEGFYNGTIFHRALAGTLVQGGGYTADLQLRPPTHEPVRSEATNGLKNVRGTVGLARDSQSRDSGTCQFYINVGDNYAFDETLTEPGYTVFGGVVEGMDVVDQLAAATTTTRGDLLDVPENPVVINAATIEAGPRVLSAAWQQYQAEYQYNFEYRLRQMLVSVLQSAIANY